MSERKAEVQAGIVFILSVIVLVGGVLWLKNFRLGAKNAKVRAEFPSTSGLVQGDPVEVLGVPAGQVDEITYQEGVALVLMQLDRRVALHRDAHFVIRNVGIMGQKMVSVDPGRRVAGPAPPDTVFSGGYEPGIPEFVTNMGETVQTFRRLGERLDNVLANVQEGDNGNLAKTIANLAAVTTDLRDFMTQTQGDLASSVHNLDSAMGSLDRTLSGREEEIGMIIDNSARASARFDTTLAALDRASRHADMLMSEIDRGNGR
jgi:phospholipid/cholesterol/gamma-HCH transport system substrate-binding protein